MGVSMITEKDFKKIMRAFDFDKVKKAMDAMGWNYLGGKEPVTIEELKNMAWCLYEGVDWSDNARCSSSCGGFTLRKPHGGKYLTLSFNLEEVSGDMIECENE